MGTLTLVRHGQASFGSADYDRLSELGQRQCRALGEHFAARGLRFDAVLRGTLRRHRESLEAIVQGLGPAPAEAVHGALDEYDSQALIEALDPGPLPPATSPEGFKQHFRVLRDALLAWMDGRTQPRGMPSYAAFCAGITEVLDRVREAGHERVLVVSSGGPISTAVGLVLQAPPAARIEMNMRIRNSALTEFAYTTRRHVLHSFNHLPHLDDPGRADWQTYT